MMLNLLYSLAAQNFARLTRAFRGVFIAVVVKHDVGMPTGRRAGTPTKRRCFGTSFKSDIADRLLEHANTCTGLPARVNAMDVSKRYAREKHAY